MSDETVRPAAWVKLEKIGVAILSPTTQVRHALATILSRAGRIDVSKFIGIATIAMTDSALAEAVKLEDLVSVAQAAIPQSGMFIECAQFARPHPQFWTRFVDEGSLVGQAFEYFENKGDKGAYIQLGKFALSEAELSGRFASEWFPRYVRNLVAKNKFEELLVGSAGDRGEAQTSIGHFAKSNEVLWSVFSPEFIRELAEALIAKPVLSTGNYLTSLFELIKDDEARLSSLPLKAISKTAEEYASFSFRLEKFLKLAKAAENRGEVGVAAFATPVVVTKFMAAYAHEQKALSSALSQLEEIAPNIHAVLCREMETQRKAKADLAGRQSSEKQLAAARPDKKEGNPGGNSMGGRRGPGLWLS